MSDNNQKPCSSKEEASETPNKKRGRRIKYHTDEERIEARRKQQKAYRDRKRKELLELKEMFKKEKKDKKKET